MDQIQVQEHPMVIFKILQTFVCMEKIKFYSIAVLLIE